MKTLILSGGFAAALLAPHAGAQNRIVIRGYEAKPREVAIDALFEPGKLWTQTAADIETTWKDKGFKWNSEQVKDRGVIRRENWGFEPLKLNAFGKLTVEEVVFVLKDGRLSEVALLPWNKGDSENSDISEKAFNTIVESWTAELNKCIAPNHKDRGRDTASAARAERRMWIGKETLAQLEFSGGRERIRDPYSGRERNGPNFQGEFIRLRLLPKPDSVLGLDASTGGTVAVSRGDLSKSVVREPSGDVLIPNVPMVDQGDKGYCAVATSARILNYYGVPAERWPPPRAFSTITACPPTSTRWPRFPATRPAAAAPIRTRWWTR